MLGRWMDHLAPRRCALCLAWLAPGALPGVCRGCLLDLPGASHRRCARCALPLALTPRAPPCACLSLPWPIDRTVAVADYAPPLDRLIGALKFGRDLSLARPLGELLALAWLGRADPGTPSGTHDAPPGPSPDCLVAVPLSEQRLAGRGFNQSLEMARVAARALGGRLPVLAQGLRRSRHTPPQSGLDLPARRLNLLGSLCCDLRLDGQRVGLVDDVMTSGSTACEAARALKAAGATSVVVLVAARTA